MTRRIAEWLWRTAVLVALGWIGWELHVLHEDVKQLPEDQATVAAAPDETQDSLDEIRDELVRLAQKVDAILVVMARAK